MRAAPPPQHVTNQEGTTLSERTERIKAKIREIADSDAAERQKTGLTDAPVGSSENPSTQIFTVANVITFCRLGLTAAFLVLFALHIHRTAALVCYAVAAVTDFLDGQVARRTQTVSWLGKIMDPVMDRVLLFTGVLGLLLVGELPVWVPVFVIGRDVYLALGGLYLQRFRKRPVDVVYIGKIATALLMFGFCDLLLGWPEVAGLGLVELSWLPGFGAAPVCAGTFFVYAGVLFSAATAVTYTVKAAQVRAEALRERAKETR